MDVHVCVFMCGGCACVLIFVGLYMCVHVLWAYVCVFTCVWGVHVCVLTCVWGVHTYVRIFINCSSHYPIISHLILTRTQTPPVVHVSLATVVQHPLPLPSKCWNYWPTAMPTQSLHNSSPHTCIELPPQPCSKVFVSRKMYWTCSVSPCHCECTVQLSAFLIQPLMSSVTRTPS